MQTRRVTPSNLSKLLLLCMTTRQHFDWETQPVSLPRHPAHSFTWYEVTVERDDHDIIATAIVSNQGISWAAHVTLRLKPHTDMLSCIPHIPWPLSGRQQQASTSTYRSTRHITFQPAFLLWHQRNTEGDLQNDNNYTCHRMSTWHRGTCVCVCVCVCVRVCTLPAARISNLPLSFTSVNRPTDMWHHDLASWW